MLHVDEVIRARLLTCCRDELPNEACGLVLGAAGRVHGFFPARNVALADRRGSFEIDPQDFIAADSAARDGGFEMLGCYHSHPDRGALPSRADRAAAQGGWLLLIVGHPGTPRAELRCWRLEAGEFVEEVLGLP